MNSKNINQKKVLLFLRKSNRFRFLILLFMLLSINTFAWFVYSKTVSNSIKASVLSWNVAFQNQNEVVQQVVFNIASLYPGMDEFNDKIKITNYGDTKADIIYSIEEVKILNKTYTHSEYEEEELLNFLTNNPFKIELQLDKKLLLPKENCEFKVHAYWPYESGNDTLDTKWGHDSFIFNQNNPNTDQIKIKIKLVAKQIQN